MKIPYRASLLSLMAATFLSSAMVVQAEPMVHTHQSEQQSAQEPIDTISWVERHGCSSNYTMGNYVSCDSELPESPVMSATIQDDLRSALTNLFAVRFGFGPGQVSKEQVNTEVNWSPAIQSEFEGVSLQYGWASHVHWRQSGFNF